MAVQREPGKSKRTRLTIELTPGLRRRITVAAADRGMTVPDYVECILEEALPDNREALPPRGNPVTDEMIETLARIRDSIMEGRVFTDDSADLINQAREERTAEL